MKILLMVVFMISYVLGTLMAFTDKISRERALLLVVVIGLNFMGILAVAYADFLFG